MQATNHVVFGALIGSVISEPAIAAPTALVSHFVMDTIPHYGNDPKAPRGSRAYAYRIVVDAILSSSILLLLVALHPQNISNIILCAIVAVSPDFLWPIALFIKHKGPLWKFFTFHKLIQHESRKGIILEIVWLGITFTILISFITSNLM